MRFRRRAKLFPGVYLNFSKSGISTTIGIPGASLNFNRQGTFLNTGIPGTGFYDRKRIGGAKTTENNPLDMPIELHQTEQTRALNTKDAETTTTEGLQELKKTLLDCYEERTDLKKEIIKENGKLVFATILLIFSYLLIVGFLIDWFKYNRNQIKNYITDLKNQLENWFVNIDMKLDQKIENSYSPFLESYKQMLSCEKIWDITSTISVNQLSSRSAASTSITRREVKFGFGNIDIVKSKFDALHLENANGGDLYIYPAFVVIIDAQKKFGLVDIRELNFTFRGLRFLEEEKVPSDSIIVDHTWVKVNKDGTRDKRFKENYQIPVCLYGEFLLSSNTGLNEVYSLSNYEKAENFARSMNDFQSAIK